MGHDDCVRDMKSFWRLTMELYVQASLIVSEDFLMAFTCSDLTLSPHLLRV